jgi:hypothetical protein
LNEKLREARREAETWKARLTQKMEQFKHDREKYRQIFLLFVTANEYFEFSIYIRARENTYRR